MRILVAGMVAGDPGQGGATWAVLQYVRGLERLGCDVVLIEPVDEPHADVVSYFRSLELPRAALLTRGTQATIGLHYDEIRAFDAELLINISGLLRDATLTAPVRTRVYLDLDPVFVQLWHAQGLDMGLDGHTHYATVGHDLGRTGIPLDRRWIPTVPPVVLADWPVGDRIEHDAFTTVGNWRSYGTVEWDGQVFGQKAHAVRRLIELPQLTDQRLLPALSIDPGERSDLGALAEHGWQLANPAEVAGTPDAYRRFVRGSKAELGLCKAGYVDARCGWFSDRGACYLAAGRPVVAHDTGFSSFLPCGEGLLPFNTVAEAAAGIQAVCSDYERHRRAARSLAEERLNSDLVLTALLEAVL